MTALENHKLSKLFAQIFATEQRSCSACTSRPARPSDKPALWQSREKLGPLVVDKLVAATGNIVVIFSARLLRG
jgi:hypothetical protein